MSRVFLSYSRQSKDDATAIAQDILLLGFTVWYDNDLGTGQQWWNGILKEIQECDAFVLLLDENYLGSVACMRECDYAAKLGRALLPLSLVSAPTLGTLPEHIGSIQILDYVDRDKKAALSLARALQAVHIDKPLPTPLPPQPPVPATYLSTLAQKVQLAEPLGYEDQSALVFELLRNMEDSRLATDAKALLVVLRRRQDLYAVFAEQIDKRIRPDSARTEKRGSRAGAGTGTPMATPPQVSRPPSPIRRLYRHEFDALLLSIVFALASSTLLFLTDGFLMAVPFFAIVGFFSGLLAGSTRQALVVLMISATLCFLTVFLILVLMEKTKDLALIMSVFVGGGAGAVLGALSYYLYTRKPPQCNDA